MRLLSLLRQQSLGALALLIVLSGTAYAAATLPRNSVGTKQVTNGSLLAKDFKKSQLKAGPQGPKGVPGPPGVPGAPGPEALRLAFDTTLDATPELGALGGWTFSGRCDHTSSTLTFLRVDGPGTAQVTRVSSVNDVEPATSATNSYDLAAAEPVQVLGVEAPLTGFGRQSGTVMVTDGTSTLSVTADLRAFASETHEGRCVITGTAVLAISP